jgi:4-hydroxy-tetrahydrodipicolinate reductase
MKLAVFGAAGRMGRTVVRLALEAGEGVVGAAEAAGSPSLGRDVGDLAGAGHAGVEVSADLGAALLGAEVLVDFSHASAFDGMLHASMRAGVAVVSGTTGLGDASRALIDRAAAKIPVLWAPNMSVGVQVVADLVERAVRSLGAAYDVEVVETHHRQKADAPSGTALLMVEAARRARADLRAVHGRSGQPGARPAEEIGVHALRGGGVVGDHSVHLLGQAERIEITHRALGRELFAHGALAAARFLVRRPPGRYTLRDVVAAAGASRA